MSSRETFAMYGLAFFLLVTNLPCVEDIFKQGTCDWICTADTDIDEESRNMLANGSLAKFRVLYEEQVHGDCANQTDAKNLSTTASLWLKMAAGGKPRKKLQARLQLFTQTILEGIFGGQFAFGTYKEINVSCVFKSTSIGKSGSNYSSGRLIFHTLQSVLYFVEHVANYSKPSVTFLTLLRTEKNTRLSVGVTGISGSFSSAKSAKDNDLIVTDEWLAVAMIIWIVVLLYFPAIFTFFRPSEIKLKVLRKTRAVEHTDSDPKFRAHEPVQETERDQDGKIEPDTREGHVEVPPPEHDGTYAIPSQSDNNSARSHEGSELGEGTCGSSIQHGGGATPGYSVSTVFRETKRPSDQDSEITLQRRYRHKALRPNSGRSRVNILKERFERKSVNEKHPTKLGRVRADSPQDLDDADDSNLVEDCESATKYGLFSTDCSSTWDVLPLRSETPPTGSSTIIIDAQQASTSRLSDINIVEKSAANSLNDAEPELSTSQSNRNIAEQGAATSLSDAEPASTSLQCNGNIEEQRAANSLNETRIAIVDIDQSGAEDNEEETEHVLAIIVGETYPVGFGSWIGNKLFSATHERNNAWNFVKLIFMFSALPLLFFLLLGDLFLVLLPKLHSRLSDHLPFTFLTHSLGYGIINSHPMLLVPTLVVSSLAYLIKLSCLCFLQSSTLEEAWQSCSVHRMHPTCFAGKLLQLKPCENCCNPAPSECSKYLDLPENISHNLEKQPDIFIKCWECFSDFCRRRNSCSPKDILLSLAAVPLIILIIIFIVIAIFCTSPLVCLCHGRLRRKSRIVESVLIFFSLVWVTIFSLLCAIPLGVAIVGLIKVLGSHTNEVLLQVCIAVLTLHYFWSCYKSFKTPYRRVAQCLASRYQKKYREQEKKSVANALIHYKQGDFKVLPEELFDAGCKEFKLSIKNDVALLFVRLARTLLALCFIFPILGSDDVLDPTITTTIVTFLVGAYVLIAINGDEFQISEGNADNVVDDYIATKQRDSS